MGKIEQVKESVDKALRQQKTKTGKRKIRDETQDEDEDEETNGNFNSEHNFVCELDQLSLSEDDQKSEWENGKREAAIEYTSLDECLNIAISHLTSDTANKKSQNDKKKFTSHQ